MRHQGSFFRPTSLVLLALLGPSAVAGSVASEIQDFNQQIGAHLDDLAQTTRGLDKDFDDEIKALSADVAAAELGPLAAQLELFGMVDELDGQVAAALRDFTEAVEADASAHLAALESQPNAFVVGDGGLIDRALAKAAKLRYRSVKNNFKKIHSFATTLRKATGYELVVDRRVLVFEPLVPSMGATPADAPFVPLAVDLLVTGSSLDEPLDGTICLAGTADPGNGASVDVSVVRAGGAAVALTASVDEETRRWSAILPAEGPGLEPGTYAVTVTQSGVSISDSIGLE